MAICGIGEGLEPALQGIAAAMVDKAHTASMFTNIAFVDLTARIIGGPLMYRLLDIKASHSSLSAGLSFAFSAVSTKSVNERNSKAAKQWQTLFMVIAILCWRLRLSD